MAVTTWTKFYWGNWLADVNLRRTSAVARGFWLDVLAVAAQNNRIGFVEQSGDEFLSMMATIARVTKDEALTYMVELEKNGVAKRDRRGRVYCPRMVHDNRALQAAISSGRRGGRASRDKQKGIFKPARAASTEPPS